MRLLVPFAVLLLACAGGGPADTAAPAANDQDVRGVYALAWSDRYTVRLDIAGAVQEAESDADGIVTFEGPDGAPLELDLAAWCADPAIQCPSEAWPTRVAVDQDDPDVRMDLHALRAWDADAPAAVVSGAVDHTTDQLLFGLDAGSGSEGDCGLVGISLAGGTFVYPEPADTADTGDTGDTGVDPFAAGVAAPGGPVGIRDGAVAVGWLGVCAWEGLAVAATLSISTTYEGVREGDLP